MNRDGCYSHVCMIFVTILSILTFNYIFLNYCLIISKLVVIADVFASEININY